MLSIGNKEGKTLPFSNSLSARGDQHANSHKPMKWLL
jgi:hypothetical protein